MSDQLLGCLNFGCVHFINAFPFSIYLQNHPQIHLTLHSPDRLLQMLLTKKIDIALTSSVGALHHPLIHLPSFGIAARHRILSVNLYAQPSFFTRPSRVAVPQESTSSTALLRMLCHYVWKQNPLFIPVPMHTIPCLSHEHYDALLLIGDTALQHLVIPHFTRYDLAHEWHAWTQLPFVFATLLTLPSTHQSYDILFVALEEALSNFEHHKTSVLETAHQTTQLPYEILQEYYSLLHYRLTEEDQESLYLFKHYYSHVQ